MSEETKLTEEVWHKTKGMSISIIVLLLINIVSTVWWAATLTNDVQVLKNNQNSVSELTERVIRIEAITVEYKSILNRLVNVIDRVEVSVIRIDKEQAKRASIVYKNKGN